MQDFFPVSNIPQMAEIHVRLLCICYAMRINRVALRRSTALALPSSEAGALWRAATTLGKICPLRSCGDVILAVGECRIQQVLDISQDAVQGWFPSFQVGKSKYLLLEPCVPRLSNANLTRTRSYERGTRHCSGISQDVLATSSRMPCPYGHERK